MAIQSIPTKRSLYSSFKPKKILQKANTYTPASEEVFTVTLVAEAFV